MRTFVDAVKLKWVRNSYCLCLSLIVCYLSTGIYSETVTEYVLTDSNDIYELSPMLWNVTGKHISIAYNVHIVMVFTFGYLILCNLFSAFPYFTFNVTFSTMAKNGVILKMIGRSPANVKNDVFTVSYIQPYNYSFL